MMVPKERWRRRSVQPGWHSARKTNAMEMENRRKFRRRAGNAPLAIRESMKIFYRRTYSVDRRQDCDFAKANILFAKVFPQIRKLFVSEESTFRNERKPELTILHV